MAQQHEKYYVPAYSPWPIIGAIGLFLIAFGAAHTVIDMKNEIDGWGSNVLWTGIIVIILMMFGWFRDQINESLAGMHSEQLGRSYR